MVPLVLRSASVLALAAVALSATAQTAPTASFSSALFTVFLPEGTQSQTVAFAGTVTSTSALQGVGFSGFTGSSALYSGGEVFFDAIRASLASTGTYTGPIVDYPFGGPASSAPTPLGQAGVTLTFIFADRSATNARLAVNVVPAPEPSALAALGLGAVALVRRRKRGWTLGGG